MLPRWCLMHVTGPSRLGTCEASQQLQTKTSHGLKGGQTCYPPYFFSWLTCLDRVRGFGPDPPSHDPPTATTALPPPRFHHRRLEYLFSSLITTDAECRPPCSIFFLLRLCMWSGVGSSNFTRFLGYMESDDKAYRFTWG